MRLADYIVQFMADKGILTPFVVTGRGALFLNDALAKHADVDPVFTHHEQGAAFAAVAGADITQSAQAVMVSTGCASTNVITGVLSAWQDHIPLIVISGQNTLKETTRHSGLPIKTFGQQEADIVSIVEPICKYAVMLDDPKNVRFELEKMFHLAVSGNAGPVWLDVPLDIQNARIEPEELEGYVPTLADMAPSATDLKALEDALRRAQRPVFLIGAGVRHAQAETRLIDFCQTHAIPVVYTASAVDCVPLQEEVSIGSLGSQGCSRAGAFTVQNADLVVVLGSRLNSLTTGPDFSKFARDAKIVVVDISAAEFEKDGVRIDRFVQADLSAVLAGLQDAKPALPSHPEWLARAQSWKAKFTALIEFEGPDGDVDLHDFARNMGQMLPDRGALLCDSGFIDVVVPTNAPLKRGQRVVRPVSQGAMGFALPGALGVATCTDRPVLCAVGDGSIMMNIQELDTIARSGANIKIVVVLNGMYAIIKRRQTELFRGRTIGVDPETGLQEPDFEQLARGFGLPFVRAEADTYVDQIREAFKQPGPVVITLPGKQNQDYIEIGLGRDANNRLARRPLEDQKPFLDRELFRSEMLIPTIDE
ncbi:Acetolactate synthase isozyme 1 large subunit [Tritonibacter multivorans]|uniref:Acetolactate synthase isozyme 1 large subunit n=1 Tax=Tritonibacter multivorans TaxID=928856 RepID=A0A0P1GE13_9RHOB|nr:thiamine pyrophosphate-binding protein [Tritonibacter multivorans]MDA7422198.1 thiamine pyrophosphate-binding protein [Tritonibacter multivorans]CUH74792.1 Acetolactate synthase isozyme 1 large subunit [Tritonibacter multivorans]SFD80110.1 acetolactate synthase-1/2/3 large subunit [Tritonibacter multivorans]